MGTFERFKTKTHFNSLKRLVGVTALAALAVKLLTVALATAAGDGTPLDLLARVPASVADLGAALLVFEVLKTRRPLQLAARSAILVAVSPVLFVASGIHGDKVGVAVALLVLAMWLLVDRDAPLVAGITLAIASRVEPMALLAAPVALTAVASGAGIGAGDDRPARRSRLVHFGGALAGALFAAWVPSLAWGWDSLKGDPGGGSAPGGLGPGWVLARSLAQGLAGWLLGAGRPLVLAAAVVPAMIWVRHRPGRVYAAVGLLLLAPLALAPAWSPRDLVWPAVFGYLGDARWASMYAVAAGACVAWTSTWWGTGLPWAGGVPPGTVPDGTIAGLALITWVVLGSWLFLGWRTVAVESGPAGERAAGEGVVDNRASASPGWATLPVGAPDTGGSGSGPPGERVGDRRRCGSRQRCRSRQRRSAPGAGGRPLQGVLELAELVPRGPEGPVPLCGGRTVLKVLEEGMELLLFRLGDRGYASPRERVREVVDVGAGQPAVPGLSPSSLGGLGGGQRPVALVSLRVALGLPDRGPEGRILVVATRTGPVGFLVDEVVRVLRYDPEVCVPEATRPSGYVTAGFQTAGTSWLLIDWDAIRLPTAITAPR
jgi:chemotaxis signal transduction protein